MKWIRSNIKHAARLALVALAVQFALSFGHFHSFTANATSIPQPGATRVDLAKTDGAESGETWAVRRPPANHESDQPPSDNCAICALVSMASTMLFATPPLLMLPEAVEFLFLTTDAEFVHLKSAGLAFRSRAPPAS